MQNPRDILTPEALAMLLAIGQTGSFAAAARQLGLVPSALTYRVRQIEDALDVLLFDRTARQAQATAAGQELLREAARLLSDVDTVANRVKRVGPPKVSLACAYALSGVWLRAPECGPRAAAAAVRRDPCQVSAC